MRFPMCSLVVCLAATLSSTLPAQRKVDPAFQGERIYAIVPMIGAGQLAIPNVRYSPPFTANKHQSLGSAISLAVRARPRW
jgi:hypothetical protein